MTQLSARLPFSTIWLKRLLLASLGWLAGWPAVAQVITRIEPTNGVAGTLVTLTGSNLTRAGAVFFNGVAAATYSVKSATTITAVVPAGASTGYVQVSAYGTTGSPYTIFAPGGFEVKQPSTRASVVMDGYREALYGTPLAVQTNATGYGNAVNNSQTESVGGSELDAAYSYLKDDSLHVLLTGNLENNRNALNIFFDTRPGGQTTLAALGSAMPYNNLAGLTFDPDFGADYALVVQADGPTLYAQFSNLATGVVSTQASAGSRIVAFQAGSYTGRLGMDQSNTGGVSDTYTYYDLAPANAVTGIEFVLPLAALGSPTSLLKMATLLSNNTQSALSNQTLDPLPGGTANLGDARTVDFGRYAGNQYVTVPLQTRGVPVASFAPANGVVGTVVTITGSGFTGATAVRFNGVNAASFVVNNATTITAIVPVGATTGLLQVATPASVSLSTASFVVDQPRASLILVDGYREARYGAALAVQANPTGFGNATNGNRTLALNGSELDAAYSYVHGDSLYVFVAGNLESNGNQLELFFDSQAGGQNTLASTNPNVDGNGLNALAGLTFDPGFTADYYLSIKAGAILPYPFTTYFASLGTGAFGLNPASVELSPGSYYLNLPGGRTGRLGIDNANTGGVTDTSVPAGAPGAVVRGFEVVLPLAALGLPSGSLKVAAFLNGGGHSSLSNQTLGGLPAGTANLGAPGAVNFGSYTGNQYFTVPLTPTAPVLTSFGPVSGPVGTYVTIAGTGLLGTTGIAFNGTPAPGFTLNAEGNRLTVQVPAGATAGPISVTTAGGTTSTSTGFCVQYTATASNVSRCGPGAVTLTASGAPAGGGYRYYNDRYRSTLLSTGPVLTVSGLTYDATYYVAIATGSGATACEGPLAPITITLNPLPTATITASGPTTICQGSSVVLTAATGTSYLWSTGAITQSITATQAGSYTVTVTDASGCQATSAPTTITVNPQPTVSITASGPTTFCYGDRVVLTASFGRFYRWSTGETSQSILVRLPGSYTVQVSDGVSCGGTSAPTVVTVNPLPTAEITTSASTTICVGSSVVLTATAGSAYLWSTGATTQSITATQAGSYTVQVSNGTCAATSAATTVTVNPLPTALITVAGPATICQNGGSGSTVLTASTGASYVWSTGAATQSITVTQPGSYTVQVSNGACTATSAPTVIGVSPAPAQPVITQASVGGVPTLSSSATSGNQWYRNGALLAGATGQTYVPTTSGTYTVVVTGANGCTSSASVAQAIVLATTNATLAAQVQLHPNPTQGKVTLSLPGTVGASAVRVQVLNALGQEVPARAVISSASVQLDLTGLATGVYAVRIQLGADALVVKRVVLQ